MNQAFKLKYDQMRESDPTDTKSIVNTGGSDFYQSPGHTRNVCLVWPDGRHFFLNYAYLIAGEFKPADDKNEIKLHFSSHTVSMHGYSLETLFIALLDQLPRFIVAIDPRYVLAEDEKLAIIVEIAVEKKDA